jgi:hypothetical protein
VPIGQLLAWEVPVTQRQRHQIKCGAEMQRCLQGSSWLREVPVNERQRHQMHCTCQCCGAEDVPTGAAAYMGGGACGEAEAIVRWVQLTLHCCTAGSSTLQLTSLFGKQLINQTAHCTTHTSLLHQAVTTPAVVFKKATSCHVPELLFVFHMLRLPYTGHVDKMSAPGAAMRTAAPKLLLGVR